MTPVVKIAISLPEELLQIVDEQARERGLSRSQLFRYAMESLFRREREEEDVREYVQGYLRQPETEEEVEERCGWPWMSFFRSPGIEARRGLVGGPSGSDREAASRPAV